ncbi:hypothetical protein [Nocardioides speluncae]|uniref:hypothetical protein n=1 Tax=Nocardioides speluncae TaxID=2670337 RepID=UPI000D690F8B|nr:hypothetical protein [Nocardioides speluncae]
MATYEELSALKGKLKRAAIDAWMKDQDYLIDSDSQYKARGSGRAVFKVTRPGEDGEGGGDFTCNQLGPDSWYGDDGDWMSSFDSIRGEIDDGLEPWKDLPDPNDFDDLILAMQQARGKLAVSASGEGGQVTGPGLLGGSLDLIGENSAAMSGGIITAFKTRFLLQLGATVGGHNAITIVLGGALVSERKLWREARQTVADAVVNSTDALNAYARDDSHDWTLDLKVAGAVIGGVSAFLSGTAPVLVGAGTAVSILSALNEESEERASQPESSDADGLLRGFFTSLRDLNDAIKNEEQALEDNLRTNLGLVTTLDGFDLDKPLPGVDDDGDLHVAGSPAIIHNASLVTEITGTAMPDIASELLDAKSHVIAANSATPFRRDAAVGIGSTGCFATWSDLAWVLVHFVSDLSWEVRNGAKTLELAIADMGQTDTQAADALEQHATSIAGGSGWEDYDHHLD